MLFRSTRPSPHDLRAVGATVDIAESFNKPVVFVVNAATPRARITGEAAVALSQHGMVAPVMIHHRVDFAASMVDGRTAGEAVPKSASTKEVSDLWLYVQDRLARLRNDAGETPPPRAEHLSLGPLSGAAGLLETEDAHAALAEPFIEPATEQNMAPLTIAEYPSVFADAPYMGEERRSGKERRDLPPGEFLFHYKERRAGTFGRRHNDQPR